MGLPQFHFYLIAEDKRGYIGSSDLPSRDDVLPAGLKLATEVLAVIAQERRALEEGTAIEITDDAGTVIYTLKLLRRPKDQSRPNGYLH